MNNDDSYEYEDAELVMRLPVHLRQKKGIRYFARDRRRHKDRVLDGLAIEVISSEEHADSVRDAMRTAKSIDWEGVESRTVRLGETSTINNGVELLSTSFNTINGDVNHSYKVLFPSGRRYVSLAILGKGDLGTFDDACQEIAANIRLKEPARDVIAAEEHPKTASQKPTSANCSIGAEMERDRSNTYLLANARTRSKYVHSALILPNQTDGGVRLFLMSKLGEALFPGGSTWHETIEAAKVDALETLKIRESDWVVHDGEPEWARAFKDAANAAITAYTDATASDKSQE